MRTSRLEKIMVLHVNHPQELDPSVAEALQQLQTVGFSLLNQAVLLKNINDDVEVLLALSKSLFSMGVLPYYLHVLDKVQGAAHFDIPLERAKQLHQQLQTKTSGYLVPRLVCETAGGNSKTIVA